MKKLKIKDITKFHIINIIENNGIIIFSYDNKKYKIKYNVILDDYGYAQEIINLYVYLNDKIKLITSVNAYNAGTNIKELIYIAKKSCKNHFIRTLGKLDLVEIAYTNGYEEIDALIEKYRDEINKLESLIHDLESKEVEQ